MAPVQCNVQLHSMFIRFHYHIECPEFILHACAINVNRMCMICMGLDGLHVHDIVHVQRKNRWLTYSSILP